MLLTALKTYAESLPEEQRAPPMYKAQPVRYIVDLDRKGHFLQLVDTATSAKGRGARGIALLAPLVGNRTSNDRANLLMDNAEYALGIPRVGHSPEDAQRRHQVFIERVRDCVRVTSAPEAAAVLAFLEGLGTREFQPSEDFNPTENVTFRVDGIFPMTLSSVQTYWAQISGADTVGIADQVEVGEAMQCLLCGQIRPALRRIPFKVKNVPGGQTTGTALISANAPAFESYGLTESLIAPLCHGCAEAFSTGLSALIEGESTHLRRDPLLYVFWTREQAGFSPLALLDKADAEDVKQLLRAADTARTGTLGLSGAEFYAISLAGSGGRVAVRDWIDITVGEVQANLARFFRLQQVHDPASPQEPRPLPVWRLANATVRDPRQDEPSPAVARSLYRVALTGGPLPLGTLFAVVRRLRAEQAVTRERAALIRLVLLSQEDSPWKEDQMAGLDRQERRPAYLCGRLLAVLEDAQRQALGDISATIVDRFYGSASATPIAVFGRLLRGAQAHLARLRRDRHGAYIGLQTEIQEILAGLPGGKDKPAFPVTLSLAEQGLFALGYYHQRAERFTRRVSSTPDEASPPPTVALITPDL